MNPLESLLEADAPYEGLLLCEVCDLPLRHDHEQARGECDRCFRWAVHMIGYLIGEW